MIRSRIISLLILILILVLLIFGYIRLDKKQNTPAQNQATTQSDSKVTEKLAVVQNDPQNPLHWPVEVTSSQAASETVVINKKHQLASTYLPSTLTTFGSVQLRTHAATALSQLFIDANNNGIILKIISGYLSYDSEKLLYDSYLSRFGQAKADAVVARPGFSEHQTGLAADLGTESGICNLDVCFGDSTSGVWLAENAQNYGFILRYPKDKEEITGFQYEPWHLRYVGVDNAKAIKASGKTLDQYYNIAAGAYE
jgi:D-alanyl-D-alanine carboxypeptidase